MIKQGLAVLDSIRLDELDEAIGRGKVDELLDMLLADLTIRSARIVALAELAAAGRLSAELHALRGAAASIGAARLTAAIVAMEEAEDQAQVIAATPAFTRAAEATANEIVARKMADRRKLG